MPGRRTSQPKNDPLATEIARLIAGEHANPHALLGLHGNVVRAFRPGAAAMRVILEDGKPCDMERVHDALFAAEVPEGTTGYTLEATYDDGTVSTFDDPYRFWPTLGDLDLHLFGEGRHRAAVGACSAPTPRAPGRRRHGVRGVGADGPVGAGGRRLQRVGRPPPPDALAGLVAACGSCSCPACEPGAAYKFEILDAAGAPAPEGRPDGVASRGAAGHGERS